MRYYTELTERVHLDIMAKRWGSVCWDLHVSTYVESIRPFKGYWLDLRVGIGPWMLTVYCGE